MDQIDYSWPLCYITVKVWAKAEEVDLFGSKVMESIGVAAMIYFRSILSLRI
jgi:hypothetical protein